MMIQTTLEGLGRLPKGRRWLEATELVMTGDWFHSDGEHYATEDKPRVYKAGKPVLINGHPCHYSRAVKRRVKK